MDDQEAINQAEWQRSENWKAHCFYSSPRDTRTWVPKRNSALGTTLNFAHRTAWWSLAGLCIVPLGLVLLFVLVRIFGFAL